jgi:hypothetical protein
MRGHHEGLQEFSGACKTPANDGILMTVLFSMFQEIYSGCCTVAAQRLPLASAQRHKVRDDRYSASRLAASSSSFVFGEFCELRVDGVLRSFLSEIVTWQMYRPSWPASVSVGLVFTVQR